MTAPPHCHLLVGDQCWPCHSGDVIGREGNVAPEILSTIPVLSRRQIGIEQHEGTWYAVALPEARNETFLEGLPMERGLAYPLMEMQLLQVDEFIFHLALDPGESSPGPYLDARQDPESLFPYADDDAVGGSGFHEGLPDHLMVDHLPGAVILTDLQLNLEAANAGALRLLGRQCVGQNLDTWMPDRSQVRSCLLSLEDGHASGPVETLFILPRKGNRPVELQASRVGDALLISLRDTTTGNSGPVPHPESAGRLTRQSEVLARLSLSSAFHEGDVARSFTLLAHQSAEAIGCRRVSAWLKTDARKDRKIVRQVCYDETVTPETGTIIDMDFCPEFFDRLLDEEPMAMAEPGSPVLRVLQEIGFAMAENGNQILCAGLQHGTILYGVLAFEKTDPSPWSKEDRQFALCLAGYGVLALQTGEHRNILTQLQESEARMTAELEEANRYVQRILPDPIPEGPVTAEWEMQPSEALGGDSFGYHWLDGLFVMYILDVVGHGTGMALLSVSVLNNVRARLLAGDPAMANPAGVLSGLNEAFPMENQNNMLFSMWYGVFDSHSRMLTYSSAGHPPAILLKGEPPDDAEDYATLGTEGPSIGAMEGVEFCNGQVTVDQGAKLFIFSDGAFEIPTGPEKEWTFEEFIAAVRTTRYMSGGETAYLKKRIASLCSAPSFPDDFTIVRLSFEL